MLYTRRDVGKLALAAIAVPLAIKEVLQLLKKNRWNIPANIEFETIGADLMVEIPKSLQYCKDALA